MNKYTWSDDMPHKSDWTGGLTKGELGQSAETPHAQASAEQQQQQGDVVQVGDDAIPQWLKPCDQEGDDPRLQRPYVFKQHTSSTN